MLGPMPTDNDVGTLGRDYGEVLWRPGPEIIERARITDYRRWLASDRGVTFHSASSDPATPRSAGSDPATPRSAGSDPATPPNRAVRAGTGRPNLVMGRNVQVCWEKFCRYWQVEPRMVPMAPGRYHLTGPEAAARCDENTIGVVAILGSTMDGSYEPVGEINAELDRLAATGGPDVPIH